MVLPGGHHGRICLCATCQVSQSDKLIPLCPLQVFEAVQPDLKTGDDLTACYRGVPLGTAAGVCRVKSIAGGSIK